MKAATQSSKAVGFSPGNPPALYDTSTSTEESFGSNRRKSHAPSRSSVQSKRNYVAGIQHHGVENHRSSKSKSQHHENLYPSHYFPQQQQTLLHPGPTTRLTRRYSGDSSASGGIRARSEPGVSTEFERYQKESYTTLQDFRPPAPGSDVGPLSVSEQIRQYNHQRLERNKSPFSQSRPSAKAQHRSDINTSFGSSVESSSVGSMQNLRQQLWNDVDALQVESYSVEKDISNRRETRGRRSRAARSLSPGLRQVYSYPDSDDGSAKFNSKYYQAAMAARNRGNASKDSLRLSQSPLRRRIGRDKSSTSSTARIPTDESLDHGNSRRRSSSISRTPFEESSRSSASHSKQYTATSFQRGRSKTSPSDPTNGRGRDPSVESQSRRVDQSVERQHPSASSLNKQRRGVSLEPRGRTASPLIQQRVSEFSHETQGRASDAPARHGNSEIGTRSYSQEPRRSRGTSESSSELLAREFSGNNAPRASPKLNQRNSYDQGSYGRDPTISGTSDGRLGGLSPSRASHTKVTNFWQEKVESSPKNTISEAPATLLDRSENYTTRVEKSGSAEKAQARISPIPAFDTKNDSLDKRNVAKLVAKLSAVSRDNPAEALAQIDSILRQEGRSNSAPFDETISNLLDSDDETSVSSITNPTYQEQAKPTKFSGPSSETRPPSSFRTSISTTRSPRPSALPNYIPSSLQQDPAKRQTTQGNPIKIKAKLRQEELKKYPPPSIIDFKDNSILESEDDFKVTVKQASKLLNETKRNTFNNESKPIASKVSGRGAKETPVGQRKLGEHITDKETLAAKIRVWDDMSHGLRKSKSEDPQSSREESATRREVEGSRIRTPLRASTRSQTTRAHPWDGDVPARIEGVDFRNTSMENAMGIETLMPSANVEWLKDTSSRATKSHMDSKMLTTAATNSTGDTKGKSSTDNLTSEITTNHSPFFPSQSLSTGWDITPSMTPEQQQNAQKISADFDQAWAAMPGEDFFPEPHDPSPIQHKAKVSVIDKNSEKQQNSKQRVGLVDLDESIETAASSSLALHTPIGPLCKDNKLLENGDEERGAIEVSLLPNDLMGDSRDPTKNSKPKRRGFLRSFMRKEKNKTSSNASNQESNYSVSMGSSGNRSVRSATSSDAHPSAHNATSLGPPGVNSQEYHPPPGRGRSLNSKGPELPQRSRSASTERFQRSSSMAKKFGRVMRLYDQD